MSRVASAPRPVGVCRSALRLALVASGFFIAALHGGAPEYAPPFVTAIEDFVRGRRGGQGFFRLIVAEAVADESAPKPVPASRPREGRGPDPRPAAGSSRRAVRRPFGRWRGPDRSL